MAKKQTAFSIPMQLKADLADFMGKSKASRTEIRKKIWDYGKKHGLVEGRDLTPDDTLEPIIGPDTITMFELSSCIESNIVKKK